MTDKIPLKRIAKFGLIFAITGTSSLYVGDSITTLLRTLLAVEVTGWIRVVSVLVCYQFLLVGFCFIFGESEYLLRKIKRLKKMVQRA
jgi:hypothetical protein